eukprot:c52160_g1_i1 orf=240-509(+)
MAKALISKLLLRLLRDDHPCCQFLWDFIGKAKGSRPRVWEHLSRVELLLLAYPTVIKHSSLFEGIIQALKAVGQKLMWPWQPNAEADSS